MFVFVSICLISVLQEYARFLDSESRIPKDAVVAQHIGKVIGQCRASRHPPPNIKGIIDSFAMFCCDSLKVRPGFNLFIKLLFDHQLHCGSRIGGGGGSSEKMGFFLKTDPDGRNFEGKRKSRFQC